MKGKAGVITVHICLFCLVSDFGSWVALSRQQHVCRAHEGAQAGSSCPPSYPLSYPPSCLPGCLPGWPVPSWPSIILRRPDLTEELQRAHCLLLTTYLILTYYYYYLPTAYVRTTYYLPTYDLPPPPQYPP